MQIDPFLRFSGSELWRLRGAYALYQVLIHLLLPVALVVLLLRRRKEPLYGAQWWNRLGFLGPRTQGRVFVFAASLGETRAATPLVQALLDRGEAVLMLHASAAGLSESRRAFGRELADGRIVAGYVPFDLFWAVGLFLRRHRPKLGLVMEAELWPGMLMQAARHQVPMVQVNGNYTERGFIRDSTKYGGVRLLFWRLYQIVLTKSPERAARYVAAGMPPDCVQMVGELKFDQRQKADHIAAAAALLAEHPAGGPVLGIASSIEAEEPALLEVVRALRAAVSPPPRIVWVPRSPQRFGAVHASLTTAGLRTLCRSESLTPDLSAPGFAWPDVLVGDSIGEMDFYYSLCDVVFVGATLAPMGGHNIIEPLALNRPVVTGPSIHGILYPALEAIDSGAMRRYPDAQALSAGLTDLLANPASLADFTARTGGFHAQHRGAAARSLQALAPWLEARHS